MIFPSLRINLYTLTRAICISVMLYLSGFGFAQSVDQEGRIQLSETEKAYLAALGPVKMCVDPDWAPYEYITPAGEHAGIGADLIRLIARRAGITLELIPTASWDETIEFSKTGKCHILSMLNQTNDRENWLIFTSPYFIDYNVFITREEHPVITNPAKLVDKTVVLPTGTSIEEKLRRDYPNLNIILVASERDAFEMVSQRNADMTLRSLMLAAYTIRKEGLFTLKISGQLPEYTNRLRIGVNSDYPILRDILDRAVKSITPEEVKAVVNRHVTVEIRTGTDYKLIFSIVGVFLIVLILGTIWNYQLRKLNTKLREQRHELLELSRQLTDDIAARKIAEESLRESEERLTALIADLPGMVYRCDFDTDYTMKFVSQGCIPLTGYQPEELINNSAISFAEIMEPSSRERTFRIWEEQLAKRAQVEVEYEIRHANGEIKWVWERGHGVFAADGRVKYLEGFIIDITERKMAVDAIHKKNLELNLANSEKDKFFSIIAHDLKSPFNSILGFSELLLEQVKNNDYRGLGMYADNINSSAERAVNLLGNLMTWSQSQTGRILFRPENFEVHELIDEVSESLEGPARQKDISFSVSVPDGLEVFADRQMLGTVLRNLLNNAIKYSFAGGQIFISAEKLISVVRLSVSDRGIGIPEHQVETLFSISETHSTPGTRNESGSGLGLILCKEFVGKHHGKIWAESAPGQGSTFFVELPDLS